MLGCDSQNRVSCTASHSSAETSTSAGRPLRVIKYRSCSRSTLSAYFDKCAFRSDNEVVVIPPEYEALLKHRQVASGGHRRIGGYGAGGPTGYAPCQCGEARYRRTEV